MKGFNKLRILTVACNRLRQIDFVEDHGLVNLQELYLQENDIPKIENLSGFVHLNLLDLSMNKLDSLDGIKIVSNIKELWVDYNLLNEEFEIEDIYNLPKLECVRLN